MARGQYFAPFKAWRPDFPAATADIFRRAEESHSVDDKELFKMDRVLEHQRNGGGRPAVSFGLIRFCD